uniref:ANK_REP_REGION domain-containing protein n=1 Tax=Macrostomum lignano TaxID=282301 RepID=A0A1I8J5S6_9PLAT
KSESVSWSHPHLPIAVESSGNCEFSSSPEIKQLRSLLLYDLCRFLTIGNMELTVQLDCQLADKLINPSSSSVATDDDRQVLNSLLASAFVTVHLVRVIKSCRNLTVSFKQGEAAKISVIEGEGDVILSGPLHIFHYRLNDAELAAELEASVKLYAQNSKSVSFLCVLFNEFDVNERYLTEKMRQDSMSRLSNFGTARVKLDSTPDVVKFLLENGADWSQADLKQATPLSVALERGNPDVVRAILEYDSELIHDGNWDRYASCYQTARDASHRDESVRLSNLVCLGKSTELMEALSAGSAEANLRMSAKLEYRDWRLRTPLMWAALGCWKTTTKHVECAKLLLEAGANPNAADMDGNTALHLAAAASNADVIRLLLDAGASVRCYNRQGQTPSMVAEKIETDNKEILLMLREAELLELRNTWLQRREKDPASSSSIEAETEHTKRMIELVRKVQLDQVRLDEKSYEDSASLTDESPIVETKLENNDFSLLNLNDFELEADWDKISPKVEDLTADDHYKSYQEVTRLRYTENLEDYLPSHISNESVQEATDESYKSKTSDDVEFSVFKDTSLSHCCSKASFNFAPRSLPSSNLS